MDLLKPLEDVNVPEVIKDLRDLKFHRHRRVWKPFMEKYDCQVICEIGVFQGENFVRMIDHNPKVAVGVDAWLNDGVNLARADSGYPQTRLDAQCDCFKDLMKRNLSVQLCRQLSHDAVRNFPDEYFDFVYIDADHSYEGCKQDLEDWYPKVKSGKIFAGDDYSNFRAPRTGIKFGVIKAVNEFSAKNNIVIYELPAHGWALIKP